MKELCALHYVLCFLGFSQGQTPILGNKKHRKKHNVAFMFFSPACFYIALCVFLVCVVLFSKVQRSKTRFQQKTLTAGEKSARRKESKN